MFKLKHFKYEHKEIVNDMYKWSTEICFAVNCNEMVLKLNIPLLPDQVLLFVCFCLVL